MRYKLLALCLIASACGASQTIESEPPVTVQPTVWQNTTAILPAPSQLTAITEAAEVTLAAPVVARGPQIQVTEPPPRPFDPVAYVNSLAYCWTCMDPAMEAYRVVAAWYGWDAWKIEGRAAFVYIIMATESAGCWNARRWTTNTALGKPCLETNPGVHDDVGFGQVTNVLRPLTCEKAGLCNIDQTIANPWNSMLSFVVVMDELGKRPWCYLNNTHVRNGHCAKWPG